MKTLIIDNYDSFTYNLYQYIAELKANPVVFRNDEITLEEIKKMEPTHIVISPGPGTPEKKEDIGICEEAIKKLGDKIPILGVCLGHQAITHIFGGKIIHAPTIIHGKKSEITHGQSKIFKKIPEKFDAMRYHSLISEKSTLPSCLKITAITSKDKLIMAVEHKTKPIFGIQFHPESIGTKFGKTILNNFLSI